MKVLIAQINPIIGDLKGNTQKIIESIQQGKEQKVDLVVFPEMVLTGYPPKDFLLLPHFLEAVEKHLQKIIQATKEIAALVGLPRRSCHLSQQVLYNSAAFIENCLLNSYIDKILLPTYDVFDEKRYFEPGEKVKTFVFKGEKIAVTLCEDIWKQNSFLNSCYYLRDPVAEFQSEQPTLLINLSASPYSINKFEKRLNVCLKTAQTLQCPVILCNQVGAHDSLIFDGGSLWVQPNGLVQKALSFKTQNLFLDLSQVPFKEKNQIHHLSDLYDALSLGLKDYFKKLNFKKACLGLSGGIDSAVVACLAAEVLGAENVWAISMPSRYSAFESLRDATQLAKNLGIHHQEISIEQVFASYLSLLDPVFKNHPSDVTEENLQSRIRGMILMAFSNKFGYLLLNTANKSELAMGYCTLYGDMCGALSVLGDLTKSRVYALAQWMNREKEVIPLYTLQREPSAELRLNQKDSDSLPDYNVIDHVIQAYLEELCSPEQIAFQFNYPLNLVNELIKRLHQNEFKRYQAPPCLRVSEKDFSVGRRFPLVQQWI